MISTHFDLQNIIKEMESAGNGAESSVNASRQRVFSDHNSGS